MKKKRDFVDRLLDYGVGFALLFLVIVALSISTVIFLCVLAVALFIQRLH